jgi:hypothetical protein
VTPGHPPATLAEALDAASVADDLIRSVIDLAGGEIGGGADVRRNLTQRLLRGWIYNERHVAKAMGAAYAPDQLRKASATCDELAEIAARLNDADSYADIELATLGPMLRQPGVGAGSPETVFVHRRLSRAITMFTEARTRAVLAEMRTGRPGPAVD